MSSGTPILPRFEPLETKTIGLSGQANGFYTSREGPPDTGTRFQVNANGTIAPFGPAFVTGSFHTLGSNNSGAARGTLTIAGRQGELHLELREPSPARDERSSERAAGFNPGGPKTAGSTRTGGATGRPTSLVNIFRFDIESGTGQYSHDRGTGTVRIETTPALSTSTGPGTHSSSLASTAASGQTMLTFTPA